MTAGRATGRQCFSSQGSENGVDLVFVGWVARFAVWNVERRWLSARLCQDLKLRRWVRGRVMGKRMAIREALEAGEPNAGLELCAVPLLRCQRLRVFASSAAVSFWQMHHTY